MNNITYLLGAGASCKALPLVKGMSNGMYEFLNKLAFQQDDTFYFKINTKELFEKYEKIVLDSINHSTPDTYAKKLWLIEDLEKLEIFKEFLNLYLVYLQDEEIHKKLNRTYIDPRYDVFLATLLIKENKSLILPKNINILNWNYDNQIELAYSNYFQILNPMIVAENLGLANYFNKKLPQIIPLNGQSNFFNYNLIAGIPRDVYRKRLVGFNRLLNSLINKYDVENNINFAWEGNLSKLWIDDIDFIVKNTKDLVIIGYSFPNFNRDIDKRILREFVSYNSKVYIQVPDVKEFIKIKSRFLNCVSHEILENQIEHIDDPDQFYIPF